MLYAFYVGVVCYVCSVPDVLCLFDVFGFGSSCWDASVCVLYVSVGLVVFFSVGCFRGLDVFYGGGCLYVGLGCVPVSNCLMLTFFLHSYVFFWFGPWMFFGLDVFGPWMFLAVDIFVCVFIMLDVFGVA